MQRGNAHYMALDLKKKQTEEQKQKHDRMNREAEERQKKMAEYEEEEAKEKMKVIEKKKELRQQLDLDYTMKKEVTSRNKQIESKTNDYGQHNVFTYIFSEKEHKSHALAKKNE